MIDLIPPLKDRIAHSNPSVRFKRILLVLPVFIALVSSPLETHATPAAALSAAPSTRPHAQRTPLANQMDAYIAKALREYQVPGAAIAIVQDDRVTLLKGYGVRTTGQPGNVDTNTIFQIASDSKTFTAAAAGLLVDEGKLDWDEPIINHLPGFMLADEYATRKMTMRDLLAHRTGLPQFTGDILGPFGYSRAEILARLRWLQPAYSFREKAQYSNIGFFLAGETVANIEGSPWEDVVQTRLFDTLGMTRTGALFSNLKRDSNVAKSHALVGGKAQVVEADDVDAYGAAGSVSSTATDMSHWLRMWLAKGQFDGKQILKRDTVAEIFKRSMVADLSFSETPPISENTGFYYGMGWGSYDVAGHQVIEKGGALAGVRSVIVMIPDLNMGIVILSNLNLTLFPEAVRAQFLHLAFGTDPTADEKAILAQNVETQKMFAPPVAPKTPGKFMGTLDALAGTYTNPFYGDCTILKADDGSSETLSIECGPARYKTLLKHWNNGAFAWVFPGATSGMELVTFSLGEDGTADSFSSDGFGLFTRVREQS